MNMQSLSRKGSAMSEQSFVHDDFSEPLMYNPTTDATPPHRALKKRRYFAVVLGVACFSVLTTALVLTMAAFPSVKRLAVPDFSDAFSAVQSATSETGILGTATTAYKSALSSSATTIYRSIPTLPSEINATPPVLPNIQDPYATDPQRVCPGYVASSVIATDYGFTAALTLAGPVCNAYGIDIVDLNLTVEYQSPDRLSVKIMPAYIAASNESDYLIQPKHLRRPLPDNGASSSASTNTLQFAWNNLPSFNFEITRKSTGDVLFSTAGSKLIFEDQFVEFKTILQQGWNLQGLGETIHSLRLLNNHNITIYAADATDPIDGNIYGSHPFYLDTRYYELDTELSTVYVPSGTNTTGTDAEYVSYAHGVYLRNAHGQEILLRDTALTWRTIGGSIDLYFFSGPSPAEVTKQYVNAAAGLPAMQSYWSFGYHQCRWGYANWTELSDVVDSFKKFDIPLETIWTDIDYMNQYRDFENDQNTFQYSEGQQFLANLHSTHQHYVPIVDSAIYAPNPLNNSDAYATFARGNESMVFLLDADGTPYVGSVWPGYTVFPDWRATNSQIWWTDELKRWHNLVPYSGIWIDMSEVSSFCVGSCGTGKTYDNPVHPPFALPGERGSVIYSYPEGFNVTNSTEYSSASKASASQASSNKALVSATATATASSSSTSYLRTTPTPGARNLDYPPYALNNVNGALPVHAVSPSAIHADGSNEYSIHNLFGAEILDATYTALLSVFPGRRPFIIGRSTFVGSGGKAGHWGGDNFSLFLHMAMSIPQALQMSLFGIPMFGVDTCGFNGNSDEELCNRWMQLSAFFPFYRNHNVLSAIPQEPYVWSSVIEATKIAMNIRYLLLPYIYTLFYQAHTTGSTVMTALAWAFPTDPSLADIDRQFMLGPSLLIIPVLTPGTSNVSGVFPGSKQGEVWYDWYTQAAMPDTKGNNVTIPAPLGHIPVYVRGGSILPMQQPGYTTLESRRNPWSLLVALDAIGEAEGQLYLDDGDSVAPEHSLHVDFTVARNSLQSSTSGSYRDTNALADVTVMGMRAAPAGVSFNGAAWSGEVQWNASTKVAAFRGLQDVTSRGAWGKDWILAWSH